MLGESSRIGVSKMALTRSTADNLCGDDVAGGSGGDVGGRGVGGLGDGGVGRGADGTGRDECCPREGRSRDGLLTGPEERHGGGADADEATVGGPVSVVFRPLLAVRALDGSESARAWD